jgi:hypothetical protein
MGGGLLLHFHSAVGGAIDDIDDLSRSTNIVALLARSPSFH